jgi:hypothetical protein
MRRWDDGRRWFKQGLALALTLMVQIVWLNQIKYLRDVDKKDWGAIKSNTITQDLKQTFPKFKSTWKRYYLLSSN